MLSRFKILPFNRFCKVPCINFCIHTNAKINKNITYKYSLFFHHEVQNWLQFLTHIDEDKVYRYKVLDRNKSDSRYLLLTSQELEERKFKIKKQVYKYMQMPPVLLPRPDKKNVVLDETPGLDGHDLDHAKFIFTDISKDINEKRIILVREPNGILREAEWDERKRMNQIFFPMAGRELFTPKMFQNENLQSLFERKEYKFILDRACVQFEPDDPEYIDITTKTYEEINKNKEFSMFYSTRHFGSLTFYLALHNNIDNMLIYNIESERIDDVFVLLQLYNKIHNFIVDENVEKKKLLETYIASESKSKNELELTWQTYISKTEQNNLEKKNVAA